MIQEATKKETGKIALGTGICTAVMIGAFAILHAVMPESVPFNVTVVTGGIAGSLVAIANFFLMGLTVQNVAAEKDDSNAYRKMKLSYTYRILFQIVWIILALVLPVFHAIAGILPLLFPSLVIKVYYTIGAKKMPEVSPGTLKEDGASEERGEEE